MIYLGSADHVQSCLLQETKWRRASNHAPEHAASQDARQSVEKYVFAAERGNLLRYPETDDLGDGIFELRTSLGSDMERTLFFYAEHRVIVITHGFIKKTRKTPRQEIERAKQYRADYYAQRKAENDNS